VCRRQPESASTAATASNSLSDETGGLCVCPRGRPLHRKFVKVALGRYLYGEHLGEEDVPRFLLNDLARYWRTMAVDYQAKVWKRHDSAGWALRYLKLRMSRKLTYAGSVVPLLLRATNKANDAIEFLVQQYVENPPLARLAQLAEIFESDDESLVALGRLLVAADRFTRYLAAEAPSSCCRGSTAASRVVEVPVGAARLLDLARRSAREVHRRALLEHRPGGVDEALDQPAVLPIALEGLGDAAAVVAVGERPVLERVLVADVDLAEVGVEPQLQRS